MTVNSEKQNLISPEEDITRLEPAPASCFASAVWLWGGVFATVFTLGAVSLTAMLSKDGEIAAAAVSGVAAVFFGWFALYGFGSLVSQSQIAAARQQVLDGDDNVVTLATSGWQTFHGAGHSRFGDLGLTLRAARRTNGWIVGMIACVLFTTAACLYCVHTGEIPLWLKVLLVAPVFFVVTPLNFLFVMFGELFSDAKADRAELLIRPGNLVRVEASGPLVMLHVKGFGREGPRRLWFYLPPRHRRAFYREFDQAFPDRLPMHIRRCI